MKTSTLLKTLSAVGILGTALFSINANAEGGCPSGMAPMYGNHGSCVPLPQQGGYSSEPSSNTPIIALVVDKKTDKAYPVYSSYYYKSDAFNMAKQACQADGGDCVSRGFSRRCIIEYKRSKPLSGFGAWVTGNDKGDYNWVDGDSLESVEKQYQKLLNNGKATKIVYRGCPNDGN